MGNDRARHALIRGGSPSEPSACLVSLFWRDDTTLQAYTWVERVPTASNLADGPSRLQYGQVRSLGAVWTKPVLVEAQELVGQVG